MKIKMVAGMALIAVGVFVYFDFLAKEANREATDKVNNIMNNLEKEFEQIRKNGEQTDQNIEKIKQTQDNIEDLFSQLED